MLGVLGLGELLLLLGGEVEVLVPVLKGNWCRLN